MVIITHLVFELIYNGNYNTPLAPEIYQDRNYSTGTPKYYSIYSKDTGYNYLHVTPQPTTIGKRFDLTYFYQPAAIATGSAGDATSFDFPIQFDYALIYWAIYLYKLSEDDTDKALNYRALYQNEEERAEIYKAQRLGAGIDMTQRGRLGL